MYDDYDKEDDCLLIRKEVIKMSRSYKKTPFVKCEKSCKKGKRWANKKVRACVEALSHKTYKKLFCSWDICDYYEITSWEEYKFWRGEDANYYEWYKTYKRK